MNKIEETKEKVLQSFIGCTISEIREICNNISANIEELCIYNPIKINYPINSILGNNPPVISFDDIETNILIKPKFNKNITDKEYPINGSYPKKVKYLYENDFNRNESYSIEEIANQLKKYENDSSDNLMHNIRQTVWAYSRGSNAFVIETTGKPLNKRYQFKN